MSHTNKFCFSVCSQTLIFLLLFSSLLVFVFIYNKIIFVPSHYICLFLVVSEGDFQHCELQQDQEPVQRWDVPRGEVDQPA